jgi:hypothetical protein
MKFKLIHYTDIINDFKLNNHLYWLQNEYLAERNGRHDIFDNIDIFSENIRSKNRKYKKFQLFERVDNIDVDVVIVVGFYLELLEYWGEYNKIVEVITYYSNKYPDNKIIFFWNHDTDFIKYNDSIKHLKNIFILNYNTSQETPNDIVVPFWTFSDKDDILEVDKLYFCNFIGTLNGGLRSTLYSNLIGKENYFVSQKLDYSSFIDIVSKSKFTLCPKGSGLSSYRFFECMFLGSVPVLIADQVILPYNEILDYDKMIVRIPESKVNDFEYINNKLLEIDYEQMCKNIIENIKYFRLDGIQEFIHNKILNKL